MVSSDSPSSWLTVFATIWPVLRSKSSRYAFLWRVSMGSVCTNFLDPARFCTIRLPRPATFFSEDPHDHLPRGRGSQHRGSVEQLVCAAESNLPPAKTRRHLGNPEPRGVRPGQRSDHPPL